MIIEILSENSIKHSLDAALNELAFSHYPVTIDSGEGAVTFENFTDAEAYLIGFASSKD